MGITKAQFDAITEGQTIGYCFQGRFKVVKVYKSAAGETKKVTIVNLEDPSEKIELTADDANEITL